jgi:phage FluMu gp28-like protein
VFFVCEALGSRLVKGAMDKGGNGAYLAEVTMQRFGSRVEPIQLSDGWYREHMPKLKAGLDDGIFLVPRDADVVDDLMQFKLVGGVARLPPGASRTGSDGLGRHGDAGIAGALARYASTAEPIAYEYTPVPKAASPGHGNGRDMRMHADTAEDDVPAGIFAGGSF